MNDNQEKSPEFLQGYHYAKTPSALARSYRTSDELEDLIAIFENYPGPCAEIARGMAAYYRECANERRAAAARADHRDGAPGMLKVVLPGTE